jgi:hypothetical protein
VPLCAKAPYGRLSFKTLMPTVSPCHRILHPNYKIPIVGV